MLIKYEEFLAELNKRIKNGEEFYLELLETVIRNPSRYSGLFRLSNARTKLMQNVTQSNEIRFGDFMEAIVTMHLEKLGYKNLPKEVWLDNEGNRLNIDQLFTKENRIYLVEQKIRDDHDSTKKRGQYDNFRKKVSIIRKEFPSYEMTAAMWFIDDSLVKNKKYYLEEMSKSTGANAKIKLYYGKEFFDTLEGGKEAWSELVTYLTRARLEDNKEEIFIPDFGTSVEIYEALLKLSEPLWKKLNSDDIKYVLLRKELFSNGDNLQRAKEKRSK